VYDTPWTFSHLTLLLWLPLLRRRINLLTLFVTLIQTSIDPISTLKALATSLRFSCSSLGQCPRGKVLENARLSGQATVRDATWRCPADPVTTAAAATAAAEAGLPTVVMYTATTGGSAVCRR